MMAEVLAALAASDFVTALRMSRWLYAGVNTAHVLGIALLVGAILPLDLRLLGFWPGVPRDYLVRVLVPVAATGLALALAAGALLFATRAPEYAALTVFRVKLGLVACLVPWCDGITFTTIDKDALWDKYFTAAPRPLTPCERQYSDRKLRSRS